MSHRRLCKPNTFTVFHRWGLCLTIIGGSFTRGRIYPCLLIPDTYFLYHFIQPCDSAGRHLNEPSPPSNTKHSVNLLTMHSHPFNAMSPCICNAVCHCMFIPCHIYDECYMDNSTHAYHECIMNNYIDMHIISIHSFNVNIYKQSY